MTGFPSSPISSKLPLSSSSPERTTAIASSAKAAKENSIETLRLIGCADKLIFPKSELPHGINFAILKAVSDFLDSDTLQYYIDQYEFEEELLTEGISRMEQE